LDLPKAISRKRSKIGSKIESKLVLITNSKSHMSFRLVPKLVTLNDLERRNGSYFALFQRIRVASGAHCVKVQFAISSPDEFLYVHHISLIESGVIMICLLSFCTCFFIWFFASVVSYITIPFS